MKQPIVIDITEVVKSTGIAASTLRYYEQVGMIQSLGREGLKRIFRPQVIEQLALIKLGQNAGFSLQEIKQMFNNCGQPEIDRKTLSNKADEIDRNIKKLIAMRDGLRHAAACPAPNHLECPKFQRLIRVNNKIKPNKTSF